MGGLWETGVKSCKYHKTSDEKRSFYLREIVDGSYTNRSLSQFEATVTAVSADPTDLRQLISF